MSQTNKKCAHMSGRWRYQILQRILQDGSQDNGNLT